MSDEKPTSTAPDPDSVPARRQRALEALCLNPNHALAAEAAGVSTLTLCRLHNLAYLPELAASFRAPDRARRLQERRIGPFQDIHLAICYI